MGIGRKVLVLNLALSLLSVVLVFIIGHQIWNTGYLKLETNDVHGNTSRAYQAWTEEVDVLSAVVGDWAPWNEMSDFALQPGEDSEFAEKNLDDATLANFKINRVIIANPDGEIIYTKAVKTEGQQEPPTLEEFVPHVKKISNLLPAVISRDNNIKGFVMMSHYPVLISAQRISRSGFEGQSPGILIIVRDANVDYVKQIAKRVRVDMLFIANRDAKPDIDNGYWQEIIDEQQVKGYQAITDIYGNGGYLLENTMSRDIYQQGQQQMRSYAVVTLLFGVVISVITVILFEKWMLRRLRKLDGFMKSVVSSEDAAMRLQLPGNDELSRTATTMNNMLERIQESQEKLRYLSQHDGLTGLYNRMYFEKEIKGIGNKNLQSIGVISCDVDGLKFANDALGHSAGDDMLIKIAKILKSVFKDQGKVIRMGGDEFLVLLADVNEEFIRTSCQNIDNCLEQVNMFRAGFKLRMSVGWEYRDEQPIHGQTVLSMIREADDVMYRKKLAGSFEKRRIMMQEVLKMLDFRDYINEGHGERVADMSVHLGEAIGLLKADLEKLKVFGKYHDVGKVGIAGSILFKQGMLTTDERIEMERHSEIGYRIAQTIPELMPIADFILKHHEWWNGQGYPIGLQGLDIPVEDRILAITEAYDEMTNDRPYRKALSHSDALAELQRLSGIQFDPELVRLFIINSTKQDNRYADS